MPEQSELQKKVSFLACLRLEGEDLVPEQITEYLGVEPDTSWKRGDTCKSPVKPVHDCGGWCFAVDGEWGESLADVMADLFSWFESKEEDLARLSAQFNGYVSIGLCYQTKFIFSPILKMPLELVKKLGDLNLALYVNVYPCSTPGSEKESDICDSENTCGQNVD
jgi:hypothetical protein